MSKRELCEVVLRWCAWWQNGHHIQYV